jgi:NADP-dependent 3-hydroxy acid dehydrogenase YdfG
MDTGLGGKVAMVSGAIKGIGRAIAEKLAVEGIRLSLCARGADQLGTTIAIDGGMTRTI